MEVDGTAQWWQECPRQPDIGNIKLCHSAPQDAIGWWVINLSTLECKCLSGGPWSIRFTSDAGLALLTCGSELVLVRDILSIWCYLVGGETKCRSVNGDLETTSEALRMAEPKYLNFMWQHGACKLKVWEALHAIGCCTYHWQLSHLHESLGLEGYKYHGAQASTSSRFILDSWSRLAAELSRAGLCPFWLRKARCQHRRFADELEPPRIFDEHSASTPGALFLLTFWSSSFRNSCDRARCTEFLKTLVLMASTDEFRVAGCGLFFVSGSDDSGLYGASVVLTHDCEQHDLGKIITLVSNSDGGDSGHTRSFSGVVGPSNRELARPM